MRGGSVPQHQDDGAAASRGDRELAAVSLVLLVHLASEGFVLQISLNTVKAQFENWGRLYERRWWCWALIGPQNDLLRTSNYECYRNTHLHSFMPHLLPSLLADGCFPFKWYLVTWTPYGSLRHGGGVGTLSLCGSRSLLRSSCVVFLRLALSCRGERHLWSNSHLSLCFPCWSLTQQLPEESIIVQGLLVVPTSTSRHARWKEANSPMRTSYCGASDVCFVKWTDLTEKQRKCYTSAYCL